MQFFRCCYCNVFVLLLPPFLPPPPPSFPRIYLLNKHCMTNIVLFLFSTVFSSRCLFFLWQDLHITIFAACGGRILCPLVSARFVRYLFFFSLSFFVLAFKWKNRDGAYFSYSIFALFACFLAGLLCVSFWFPVFLLLPSVVNTNAQGPVSTHMPFFRAPPIINWPIQLIPTIHGHMCTSSLVCVLVACVLLVCLYCVRARGTSVVTCAVLVLVTFWWCAVLVLVLVVCWWCACAALVLVLVVCWWCAARARVTTLPYKSPTITTLVPPCDPICACRVDPRTLLPSSGLPVPHYYPSVPSHVHFFIT